MDGERGDKTLGVKKTSICRGRRMIIGGSVWRITEARPEASEKKTGKRSGLIRSRYEGLEWSCL